MNKQIYYLQHFSEEWYLSANNGVTRNLDYEANDHSQQMEDPDAWTIIACRDYPGEAL